MFSDHQFLSNLSISADKIIKLFVRVKERIKPDQCLHKVTSTGIQITLIKENEHGLRWNRLEPNEFSELRSFVPSSPPSSTINTNISNKGINIYFIL